ncbi:MAG: hypothetical protein K8T25_13635 [Planctomycetia bacterium]|nr:hypothetical protein [Planctomycetia bacterium]
MPQQNRFGHHDDTQAPPSATYRLLTAPPQPAVDSPEFAGRMHAVGQTLRASHVELIVVIHGTFVGDDFFDLAPIAESFSPAASAWMRRTNKAFCDHVLGDAGNFPPEYATRLSEWINPPGERLIEVRNFVWSGVNTHSGRVVGAIRFIDELATWTAAHPRDPSAPPPRILCLGHSHGGNLLAIATNLLGADAAERRPVLDAVRNGLGKNDGRGPWHDAWHRACARLEAAPRGDELLGGYQLDLVSLGAPVRYRWDPTAYGHLLHLVNHLPEKNRQPWQAPFPVRFVDFLRGRGGDYVHQIGVAGSDFPCVPLRWRLYRAERALRALMQPRMPAWKWPQRFLWGRRVSDDGTTLLIDYGIPRRRRGLRHLFGHGVYTQFRWMPFQFELVTREFYGREGLSAVGCRLSAIGGGE